MKQIITNQKSKLVNNKNQKVMKQLVTKQKRMRRLVLLTVLAGLMNVCAFAQAKITPAEIKYWVGNGSNEAILIVHFCNDNIGFAWGYRFDGTPKAGAMFAAINAADSRLNISGPPSGLNNYSYQDGTYSLTESANFPYYGVNELMAGTVTTQDIVSGDIVEIGGPDCATTDWYNLTFSNNNIVPVSDPNAPTGQYTVHATSSDIYGGVYGTIAPAGDSTVTAGESITYYFTPDAGYHLGSVSVGNTDVTASVSNNSYTFANITSSDTVRVMYAVDKNNTITTSDILYWVGSGQNEVIFAVNWCEKSLAWGYKFNTDSVLVSDVFNAIKAADARFDYTFSTSQWGDMIQTVTYTDNSSNLSVGSWVYNVNEESVSYGFSQQWVRNGDIIESGDYACVLTDNFWNYVWTAAIESVTVPTSYTIHAKYGSYGTITPFGDSTVMEGTKITYTIQPDAGYSLGSLLLGDKQVISDVSNNSYTLQVVSDDTLFAQFVVGKNNDVTTNDILYWVGEGTNEVIFIVNWCNPEIAFAWGYRFNGSSVLVSKVMEDIKAADSRFDYEADNYVNEITYKDDVYDLKLTEGNFWGYNVNDIMANAINQQDVFNHDIIEFGDLACAISDESWNSAWTTPITPVTVPPNVGIVSAGNTSIEILTYPNPANDYTFVTISGLEGNISMSIVDISGKEIQGEQFYIADRTVRRIETNHFAKGIYFIRLQGDNYVQTKKLIVY
ncbi:MAG: T9SS type A sorting domain-containing protein [Bacteroidales bacterium]|jgi:hypothetical protein|nr:T9SS type A sorting domain-containing protein [Bacteroidales bacterium]